jgi:hypothetical protein
LQNKVENDVIIKVWHKIKIVKVSRVGEEFSKWLYGQTMPLIEDDEYPYDWAYYSDYLRFKNGLKIID